jgi:hypothetical protein
MNFYKFSQNNSGGSFDTDENLCQAIYIEAESEEQANQKALELGIYFNGVEEGIDCDCCGDRWCPAYGEERDHVVYLHSSNKDKLENVLQIPGACIVHKPGDMIKHGSVTRRADYHEINFDSLAQSLKAKSILDSMKWTSPSYRIFYANGEVEAID